MIYKCGDGKDAVEVHISDVVDLAREAGGLIMNVYTDPENLGVRTKSDETPVTRADILANELICSRLAKAYPGIPIISEESEHLPYEERRHYQHYWVVDPLDGTKDFIYRTGDFGVMIGLCQGDSPVIGVVHAPARGGEPMTYYASKGVRSFDAAATEGLILVVSRSRPPAEFISSCAGATAHETTSILEGKRGWQEAGENINKHLRSRMFCFLERLGDKPTLSMGSAALKAIAVAEGKADIFPCLYNISEWDTCATHAIVEEAGGSVVPLEGARFPSLTEMGGRLVYNKESLSSPKCLFLGKMILPQS